MVLTQAYESDTLARNICREIADQIPGTTFIDWGHHYFDEFYLKDIRRLRRRFCKRQMLCVFLQRIPIGFLKI